MTKRPSLTNTRTLPRPAPQAAEEARFFIDEPHTITEVDLALRPAPRARQPSRENKRALMVWLDKAAYQEIQVAAIRMETTLQAAGEEMVRLWCARHAVRLPETT